MPQEESWHGTHGGYTNHKCRCDGCRDARNAYHRAYHARRRATDPEYRASRVWTSQRYGLPYEDYLALMEAHDGRCEICRERPLLRRDLCLDHDHETGRVRGVLCRKCNAGIGQLGDSSVRLAQALVYLEAHA